MSIGAHPKSRCFVRMFKPQFAPMVEAGTKRQTVRPVPKRIPMPGDSISLRAWDGKPYRSKQRVLRESLITAVHGVQITVDGWVCLDGIRIKTRSEIEAFAQADGFATPELMLEWFRATHGLPFTGIVINW